MAAKLALSTQVLLANKKENLALNMLRRALKYYPDSSEARAVLKMMAKTNKDAADFLNELPGSGPADAKAPTQLEPEQKSKQK